VFAFGGIIAGMRALGWGALSLLLDTPAVLRYFGVCSASRRARSRRAVLAGSKPSDPPDVHTHSVKFSFSAIFRAQRTAQRRVSDPWLTIPSSTQPSPFPPAPAAASPRRGIPADSGPSATSPFGNIISCIARWRTGYTR
jgi:hypothetical protein